MSRRPSDPDHIEKILESARRDVRQLEIDAARIRTDLAQLEAANAIGVLDGEVAPLPPEDPYEAPARRDVNSPIAPAPSAIEWQPAAAAIPDGMEILVGEELIPDDARPAESSDAAEPFETDLLNNDSSTVDESITPLRALYRRIALPMVENHAGHSAIIVLTLS